MSYTYLQEGGAEYSAECFSDIAPSVRSRLNRTAETSCSSDNATESCPGSRSGTTCEHSTERPGGGSSISFVPGSPVRTSASPERGRALTGKALGSGLRWSESLAKWDRDTSSWKTHQLSLQGGLVEFSETWPKWGTTVGGVAYRRKTPSGLAEHRQSITSEQESGYSVSVPTPTVNGNYNAKGASKNSGDGLVTALRRMSRVPTPTKCQFKGSSAASLIRKSGKNRTNDRLDHFVMAMDGGPLNPEWTEWLMGWPIGWTDLKPLETDKFRQWLNSHGISCREVLND
jgi:hypothetical protein